jgi:subtilisin-like proprotein convertase family protein
MKQTITTLFTLALFIIVSCNKETDDWKFCSGCTIEAWTGTFSGNGKYYDSIHNEGIIKDIPLLINIENPFNQTLDISVSSPQEFSWQFTGQKQDNDYYINIAGSSQSLILNLYKNDGGDYKLSGVAKLYQYNSYDSTYHTTASVTFEALKNN